MELVIRSEFFSFSTTRESMAPLINLCIQRIQPASLRLVDNVQFIMGQALKVATNSYWAALKSSLGKMYITKWKGFHVSSSSLYLFIYLFVRQSMVMGIERPHVCGILVVI